MATGLTEAELHGVYKFQYSGGEFRVQLRSGGRFFAQEYQQPATWTLDPPLKKISIEWKKYGQYELILGEDGVTWEGSMVGKPESWRKMILHRKFSVAEQQFFDSEWDFQHEGGSFPVKFKADGYNHFICDSFPAHSHWKLENDDTPTPTVKIDWGKYGKYELKISEDGCKMSGSAVNQPDNWRKADRTGKMDAQTPSGYEHDHH